MDLKPSVLAVCFFSSPGAVADNFHTLCRALAPRTRLSVLTSEGLRSRPIEGVEDACYLNVQKRTLVRRLLNPFLWSALARFSRRREYDLVFFYSEHPLHAAVGHLARARRSLFWFLDPTVHSGSRTLLAALYEIGKRSLARQADRIVVACDGLRLAVMSRYGVPRHRVFTSFHGVLENLQFPDIPADGGRDIDVLFFGRLEAYKGLDVLVEAVKLIQSRGRTINVLAAGPGSFKVPPTRGMTIDNRYLPDRELARLVARARIVVMPYRDATGSQVPQTAFYYGTPVVASSVGCLSEYVEDGVTGLLVSPGSPDRLASALERLLDDRALWESASRNARERANTIFDNERLVGDLLKQAMEGDR